MNSLWQRCRWRWGIFSRQEILEAADVSFSLGYEQGKKDGYNQALNALPKVLADLAEERLNKLLPKAHE